VFSPIAVSFGGAMGSQRYTVLPSEKANIASVEEVASSSPPWKKPFLIVAGLISLFLLAFLVVAEVGTNVTLSTSTDNVFVQKEKLLPKAANSGDQYLIGVGKADITGLVYPIFLKHH
jgi:hypothetical protein